MIILDTNVVSACMRPSKNNPVIAWLDAQPPEMLWTTTITLFELRYGIENLGQEDAFRADLETAWEEIGSVIFENRILPFDMRAARTAAELAASRRRKRRAVGFRDTFIAGIALSRNATLATRNLKDFKDAGVPLVDPWKDQPN
jgi:predicted nucleic acid-binding protein